MKPTKSSLSALIMAGLFSHSVAVLADPPQVYGVLNIGLTDHKVTNDASALSGHGKVQDGQGIDLAYSTVGLKGLETLNRDMDAIYKVEFVLNNPTEDSKGNWAPSFNDVLVGLTGTAGTFTLGRMQSVMAQSSAKDVFADSYGNDTHLGSLDNQTFPSVFSFKSTDWHDVRLGLSLMPNEQKTSSSLDDGLVWALSYGNKKQGFYAAISGADYDPSYQSDGAKAWNKTSTLRGSMQIYSGNFLGTLMIEETRQNANGYNSTGWQGGMAYRMNQLTAKIKWSNYGTRANTSGAVRDSEGVTGNAWGLNYTLARRTQIAFVDSKANDGNKQDHHMMISIIQTF